MYAFKWQSFTASTIKIFKDQFKWLEIDIFSRIGPH